MDYNDINRYREEALKTKREIESTKTHYTYDEPQFDAPGTMDNIPATILYIFVMVGGAIFHDRALIWAMASVVYFCHIFRHKLRKK